MEYVVGAFVFVVAAVIVLQYLCLLAERSAVGGLKKQVGRLERDKQELRFKLDQAKAELDLLPIAYKKPDAIHITLPGRRREDIPPMVGGGVSWED